MPLSGHSPKVKEVLSDKQAALTVEQWQSDGAGGYSTRPKAVSNFKWVFLTELSSGAETPCTTWFRIQRSGIPCCLSRVPGKVGHLVGVFCKVGRL